MADPAELRILDVCAGGGMFGVAVECAFGGGRVVCFVERQAHSAAVLLARMEDEALPPAPIWCGDIERFDGASFSGCVDLVCAGFPCQPWSVAGLQLGVEDERWILPAILDAARAAGSPLVALENNPGVDIATVVGELVARGYADVQWMRLRASDVGATHERDRVFLLAYSDEHGQRSERGRGLLDGVRQTLGNYAHGCGGENWPDADCNGVREQSRRRSGKVRQGAAVEIDGREDGPDADSARHPRSGSHGSTPEYAEPSCAGDRGNADREGQQGSLVDRLRVGPPEGRVEWSDADCSRQPQGFRELQARQESEPRANGVGLFAFAPRDPRAWDAEMGSQPAVDERVHGMAELVDLAHRKQQHWLTGNGVVPLQAAVAIGVLAARLSVQLERS